jgi:hypothetical protein
MSTSIATTLAIAYSGHVVGIGATITNHLNDVNDIDEINSDVLFLQIYFDETNTPLTVSQGEDETDLNFTFDVSDFTYHQSPDGNYVLSGIASKAGKAWGRYGARKYLTYWAKDLDHPGKIYYGRTSGPTWMPEEEILKKRRSGHKYDKKHPRNLEPLQSDTTGKSYRAMRGREHLQWEQNQAIASNLIAPISAKNKNKLKYILAAEAAF